jgi:hemolysin-activating ACP:hemolysin acyltransferase
MIEPALRTLLKDSVYHRRYSEADILRTIYPAIREGKCLYQEDEDGRLIGFLTWAFFHPHQVDGYLNKTRKLKAIDFMRNDGELWFIDFVAPYGNVRSVIRGFQRDFQDIYPDIKFGKMFRRAKGYDARVIVRTK